MAVQKIGVASFLSMARQAPILDVRSPAEFTHAHIPGAYAFPLFTDEQRKDVGTTYKQVSREAAIKKGLTYFGPGMRDRVEKAEALLQAFHQRATHTGASPKTLLVHCWRGGMRSAAVSWLLDLYGFNVYTLAGGYKAYRHWVIDTYTSSFPMRVLGGYTGSGKTYILQELAKRNEPVLDLEHIAGHRGSAFGNIGMPDQPSQEHFENLLATALNAVGVLPGQAYTGKPLWVEDESQRIGTVNLPQHFWTHMRQSPVYFMEVPFAERLDHVVKEYGSFDREQLVSAVSRISRRLGGLETKQTLEKLAAEDISGAFAILLRYYDKYYLKGLHNRNKLDDLLQTVPFGKVAATSQAEQLLKFITQ